MPDLDKSLKMLVCLVLAGFCVTFFVFTARKQISDERNQLLFEAVVDGEGRGAAGGRD